MNVTEILNALREAQKNRDWAPGIIAGLVQRLEKEEAEQDSYWCAQEEARQAVGF
jgi:hypothetical protein